MEGLEFFLQMAKNLPLNIQIGMLKENIAKWEKNPNSKEVTMLVEMSCTMIVLRDTLKEKSIEEVKAAFTSMKQMKNYKDAKN